MPYKCSCGFASDSVPSFSAHFKHHKGAEHQKIGWVDPITGEIRTIPPSKLTPKPAKAPAPLEPELATFLEIVTQASYTLANTPNIMIPYVAAKRRGFPGDIQQWFELAGNDYWLGRQIDPYKEVGYGFVRGLELASKSTKEGK